MAIDVIVPEAARKLYKNWHFEIGRASCRERV